MDLGCQCQPAIEPSSLPLYSLNRVLPYLQSPSKLLTTEDLFKPEQSTIPEEHRRTADMTAVPRLKLYFDIVSPFAWMAFYALEVGSIFLLSHFTRKKGNNCIMLSEAFERCWDGYRYKCE
jgi:hypothetical protein